MEKTFLIEPSSKYNSEFVQMAHDYEKHGERKYFDMYKESIDDFDKYVEKLMNNSKGIDLPKNWVPCSNFWLINSKNEVLGVIRIRKEINLELKNVGGHIGYDISPSNRRNGYAKEMLSLALKKCKDINIKKVLITCDKKNIASAKTIIRNGGVMENEVSDRERITQRYWIVL